jgi:hypothetical protein
MLINMERGCIQVWSIGGVHMGAYGGDSIKSLKLYSNENWVQELYRPLSSRTKLTNTNVVVRYTDKNGCVRVRGGSALKDTQAYPVEFGRVVGKLYKKHMKDPVSLTPAVQPTVHHMKRTLRFSSAKDMCVDAELPAVRAYLSM